MRILIRNCLVVGLAGVASAYGANDSSNPEALARKLAVAYKAGDMDAALALFDMHHGQSMSQHYFMQLVLDCFEKYTCTISPGPLEEEFKKRLANNDIQSKSIFDPMPEGQMNIDKKPNKAGAREYKEWLPYAKVDGAYKVTGIVITKAWQAKQQGITAQSITDELLAKGPILPSGRDPEWKRKANVLPPGGGEAGAALIARVNGMATAAKSNDVNAMIAVMGSYGEYIYGEKDSDGNPVSLRRRQLLMRVDMMSALVDVTVLGGYQLNNFAVLVIEGRRGDGWIERGEKSAVRQQDGEWAWTDEGLADIAFPPDMGK